jgi:hypothetical protein
MEGIEMGNKYTIKTEDGRQVRTIALEVSWLYSIRSYAEDVDDENVIECVNTILEDHGLRRKK